MGRKLCDKYIKAYRSSMAQLEYYRQNDGRPQHSPSLNNDHSAPSSYSKCEQFLAQLSIAKCDSDESDSDCDKSISGLSQSSLGGLSMVNLNRLIEMKSGSTSKATSSNGLNINRIVASGFSCQAKKSDLFKFFKGINIPNGINSINVVNDKQNDLMEAFVDVATAGDHDAALQFSGRLFDSRKILGNFWLTTFYTFP